MNVYDEHPFKVIFDYAHNAHAVGAMADLAGRLDVRGRRIVVIAGPGDRRDEDIRAIAHQVAGRFDRYICRRDDSLRGRAEDEIPRMIAATLREHGVAEQAIDIIPDEQAAIDAALRMGEPGDLLLVFADALTRSWKQIIKFKPQVDAPGPRAQPGAAASPEPGPGAPSPQPVSAASASTPVRPAPATSFVADESPGGFGGNDAALEARGFVREERGLRFVGEAAD
jgi:cyanophycin synthetase